MEIISVDISKDWFDAAIRVSKNEVKCVKFDNDGKGRNELHKWLKGNKVADPIVFMESTGRYGEELAEWSDKHGWKVSILNPRSIRKFAESRLAYRKTDKLDAQCILRFAEGLGEDEIRLWKPCTTAHKKLKECQMVIAGMQRSMLQMTNRMKSGVKDPHVKSCLTNSIALMKQGIDAMVREANQLIKQDVELRELSDALIRIVGFGPTTVRVLLARINFSRFQRGRQLVSYAGLGVTEWTSGTIRRKGHISRVGHSDIRSALYFPAITAMTHDPQMIALKERMLKNGKPKKVIICAVMAALLRKAFAVVRERKLAHA